MRVILVVLFWFRKYKKIKTKLEDLYNENKEIVNKTAQAQLDKILIIKDYSKYQWKYSQKVKFKDNLSEVLDQVNLSHQQIHQPHTQKFNESMMTFKNLASKLISKTSKSILVKT